MSENSTYQLLRGHLATLRLGAAAEALPRVLEEAKAEGLNHTATLERLLSVEVEATEKRRLASLERFASLPAPWRLSDFDFSAQPAIDRSLVNELSTLRFLEDATNVLFAGPRLLVIDEVGYLPLPSEAAAALFQVVTQRYLKSSTVLTTNLGIASWGRIFDDPMVAAAMLDRLLHRSVAFNIDDESYRMRSHRARTEMIRKAVH